MKLIHMSMQDYLNVLKSNAPVPGGGAAAAFSGVQGAALLLMSLELTIGKEKYKEYESVCKAAKIKAEALYGELLEAADKDADAFDTVARAFKMPKDTEEEKAARKQAIAEGTLLSTEAPFHTMGLGYEGLLVANAVEGKINPNVASDLGAAALNLISCVKGAWLNVMINLPGLKDEDKADEFFREGKETVEEAEKIAGNIYRKITDML